MDSAGAWQQFQEGSASDVSSASMDWATPHREGSSNVLDFFTPILTSSRAVVSQGRSTSDEAESKQLDFVEETGVPQESGWVAFATVSPAKVMAGGAPAGQSVSPTKPHPIVLNLPEPGSGLHLPVMKMTDRTRCERIFEAKAFARKGGLRYGAAWTLFKQTGVRPEDFHEAFVLAGDSVSGLLGQTVSAVSLVAGLRRSSYVCALLFRECPPSLIILLAGVLFACSPAVLPPGRVLPTNHNLQHPGT